MEWEVGRNGRWVVGWYCMTLFVFRGSISRPLSGSPHSNGIFADYQWGVDLTSRVARDLKSLTRAAQFLLEYWL